MQAQTYIKYICDIIQKHPHFAGGAVWSLVFIAIVISVSPQTGTFFSAQVVSGSPCINTADDDGDGNADHPADLGCLTVSDADEWQDGPCFDGKDNDEDGAVDSNDFGCRISFNGESMPHSFCHDGIDNDGDGFTDSADSGCANAQDHSEN